MSTDVAELIKRIQGLPQGKRKELLQSLPAALGVSPEDLAWLHAAESAFDFWNNPEDEVYDRLQAS